MQKIITRIISGLLLLTLCITMTPISARADEGVYDLTNAKTFYDQAQEYGTVGEFIFYKGMIVWVSKDRLASRSLSLSSSGSASYATAVKKTYGTIGYSVTVSSINSAESITIHGGYSNAGNNYAKPTVKKIEEATYVDNKNYQYTLRYIAYNDVVMQCFAKNSEIAKQIFSADKVTITINPIVIMRYDGVRQGGLTDCLDANGNWTGDLTYAPNVSGGRNYFLIDAKDRKDFTSVFYNYKTGTNCDVEGDVKNPTLTLKYSPNGGTVSSNSGFSIGGDGYINFGSNTTYSSGRLFGTVTVPTASQIGLSKPGYHLKPGAEWIKRSDNYAVIGGKTYASNEINSTVNHSSVTEFLDANWEANSYTIAYYDGYTGVSSTNKLGKNILNSVSATYNTETPISTQPPKRTGFRFVGWKLYTSTITEGTLSNANVAENTMLSGGKLVPNAAGNLTVKNLTSQNGATVYLVAQWEPKEYKITLYKDLTTEELLLDNSIDEFYVMYEDWFSLTSNGTPLTPNSNGKYEITVPTKTGYNFLGYYEGQGGSGTHLIIPKTTSAGATVDGTGVINFSTTAFTSDKTLFAAWEKKAFTLTLDANTVTSSYPITNETQEFTLEYGDAFPAASEPTVAGYTFMGYYSGKNGTGTQYYTAFMSTTEASCTFEKDTTLYAYWVDNNRPTVTITTESSGWTNSDDNVSMGQTDDGYVISFEAKDTGSGLTKLVIAKEDENGVFQVVQTENIAKKPIHSCSLTETEEGISRYSATAYDDNGNVSIVAYATIYYDKTSPHIYDDSSGNMDDFSNISGNIHATDNKQ